MRILRAIVTLFAQIQEAKMSNEGQFITTSFQCASCTYWWVGTVPARIILEGFNVMCPSCKLQQGKPTQKRDIKGV